MKRTIYTSVSALALLAAAPAFAQSLRQCDRQPTLIAALAGATDPVGDDNQAAHRIALHGLLSKTAQLMMPTNE